MSKLIFIGTVYPIDRLSEIRKNSLLGIDNASDNLQWALIKGLDKYFSDLTILSAPFIRNFPNGYKKVFFESSFFSHITGAKDLCVGFVNLIGFYSITRFFSVYIALKKKISKKVYTTLIIYSAHLPFLLAVYLLKKRGYKIKSCMIVPDLPVFLLNQKKNRVIHFLKKIDNYLIEKSRKNIDSYIILSDFMKEKFELFEKPYKVIEGIYRDESIIKNPKKEKNKVILYTGKLLKNEGIENLLEAFKKIKNSNYRLWIRGFGPMKDMVLNSAKTDFRIKVIEEMSREELLVLQKKATVLINPTPKSAKGSRYFFPSKTMDYLASGTPTIMYKLDCLPVDYHEYIYFVEDESVDGLKDKILEVCEKDQSILNKLGQKASKFIFENKTPAKQAQKLVKLLEEINSNP